MSQLFLYGQRKSHKDIRYFTTARVCLDCSLENVWRKTFELEEDRVTSYSQETVSSFYKLRLLDGWYKKTLKETFLWRKVVTHLKSEKAGVSSWNEDMLQKFSSPSNCWVSQSGWVHLLARVPAEPSLPLRGVLFRGEDLSVCSVACTMAHFLMVFCLTVWVWPNQDIFMKTYVKPLKFGGVLNTQYNTINVISPLFCSGSACWAPKCPPLPTPSSSIFRVSLCQQAALGGGWARGRTVLVRRKSERVWWDWLFHAGFKNWEKELRLFCIQQSTSKAPSPS